MLVECRTCGAEIDAPINSALPMAQCGVCRQDGAVNDRERALATARDAEMYSASHERDLARQALDAANAEIERLKGQLSQAQSDRQRQNEQRCDASDAEIVTRLRDKATAIRAAASALAGMCVLDVETVRWIADEIIGELKGRRGLRHEWEAIDDDCKEEIAVEWAKIAASAILARERAARVEALREAAADPALLEIGRKRIEDELIEWRDARLSTMMRGNGFVVCESDGKPSSIVRFGPEVGLRIGMQAMAEHLAARAEEEDRG